MQELFGRIHQFFVQLQMQTARGRGSRGSRSQIKGWTDDLSTNLPRDTHASHEPLQPQYKFEYTFVPNGSASAGAHVHVKWEDVAMVVASKQSLDIEAQRKEVLVCSFLIVLSSCLFEKKQPSREFAVRRLAFRVRAFCACNVCDHSAR